MLILDFINLKSVINNINNEVILTFALVLTTLSSLDVYWVFYANLVAEI